MARLWKRPHRGANRLPGPLGWLLTLVYIGKFKAVGVGSRPLGSIENRRERVCRFESRPPPLTYCPRVARASPQTARGGFHFFGVPAVEHKQSRVMPLLLSTQSIAMASVIFLQGWQGALKLIW